MIEGLINLCSPISRLTVMLETLVWFLLQETELHLKVFPSFSSFFVRATCKPLNPSHWTSKVAHWVKPQTVVQETWVQFLLGATEIIFLHLCSQLTREVGETIDCHVGDWVSLRLICNFEFFGPQKTNMVGVGRGKGPCLPNLWGAGGSVSPLVGPLSSPWIKLRLVFQEVSSQWTSGWFHTRPRSINLSTFCKKKKNVSVFFHGGSLAQ